MTRGDNAHRTDHTPSTQGEAPQSRRLTSRRALVAAGWSVPIVLALHLPRKAFAQISEHVDCNINPTPDCL